MGAIEKLVPDERGRITLGRLAKGVSSFQVEERQDGSLLLTPMTEIPAREVWLWRNQEALASVRRGLAQSAAGETSRSTEDFTRYITEDE